ncbi:MAG: ATP-dependent RecD-like DNA helicase [Deltaproteobacteria bacterium]|nr:ATP-dependent RecD-like DNA helicase [Deltaproteobacteria bacterium]
MTSRTDEKQLEGTIERIVFRNDTNGWTVLRLKPSDNSKGGLLTVVGAFQQIAAGETCRFGGRWMNDSQFGKQFKADTCLPLAPATLVGIEKFLGSGLIPGIGKVMAKRIVKRFGMETLEVVENLPTRLAEVEGVGEVRAQSISNALVEHREVKNVMVFLESAGISPAYAYRIFKRYGKKAIKVVSDNPYRLASDVHGIGFKMADQIAFHLGIPKDSPYRAEAGLLFALEEFATDGHVFVPREELLVKGEQLLEIGTSQLDGALERLKLMGGVMTPKRAGDVTASQPIYLPRLYEAENTAARHLLRLAQGRCRLLKTRVETAIYKAEKKCAISFAPQQKMAFGALAKASVMVLTGGPGTGKTTLLKGLITWLLAEKCSIALAAPTGRAAKRMSESTGRTASTLHRLLEFTPRTGAFARDDTNPLQQDVVVVDEVSMMDIELFASLLAAIPNHSRVVLVGDPDQLPSVGPGTVLSDVLHLGTPLHPGLQVVRLTEIFRQARSSLIVTGAYEILHGQLPTVGQKGSEADLFMIERDSPEDCLEVILQMAKERIPKAFGLDAVDDIQVLTPMHKGLLGAANLNDELQKLLNPSSTGLEHRSQRFCVGDKVMQIRNNYDLDVFNGDIGKVVVLDDQLEWLKIDFGFKTVQYPATELDQITLAYACSIHKSQGSEYPAVVIPVHTQHFVMLARNLLYTAVTRGKKLVVLVGSKRALNLAVRNDGLSHRCSGLVDGVHALLNKD